MSREKAREKKRKMEHRFLISQAEGCNLTSTKYRYHPLYPRNFMTFSPSYERKGPNHIPMKHSYSREEEGNIMRRKEQNNVR